MAAAGLGKVLGGEPTRSGVTLDCQGHAELSLPYIYPLLCLDSLRNQISITNCIDSTLFLEFIK